MRLGGPGLRQPEPPTACSALGKGLPEAAHAAVVEVDHLAVPHLAGEGAGVVALVVVVVAAVIVAPATLPVGVAGVDRDAALHRVAVALAVDVADVGHLRVATVRIAVGVALGGIDTLLDRLARIAAIVVLVVVLAVVAGVVLRVVTAVVIGAAL